MGIYLRRRTRGRRAWLNLSRSGVSATVRLHPRGVPDLDPDQWWALLVQARAAGLVERVYVGLSAAHDDHDRLTDAGARLRERPAPAAVDPWGLACTA